MVWLLWVDYYVYLIVPQLGARTNIGRFRNATNYCISFIENLYKHWSMGILVESFCKGSIMRIFGIFFVLVWTNRQFSGNFRHHDAHVTSVYCRYITNNTVVHKSSLDQETHQGTVITWTNDDQDGWTNDDHMTSLGHNVANRYNHSAQGLLLLSSINLNHSMDK